MQGARTAPAQDEHGPDANGARIVPEYSNHPLDVIESLRARYETIALVADTMASIGEHRMKEGPYAATVPPLTLAEGEPSVAFWRGLHEFRDDLDQAERAIDTWVDTYGPAATGRRYSAEPTSGRSRVESDDADDGLTDAASASPPPSASRTARSSDSPLPTENAKPSDVPRDLRSQAEVADEIRKRIVTASTALMAAWEAADATEDVDDQCLRLADVSFCAARGHNELRRLCVHIGTEWGEHPDIDLVAHTCALLAAANACATFATGLDLLDETGPAYIENIASYKYGLEWIVKLMNKAVEGEFREDVDKSDESEKWCQE